jgi:methionyl-tRNA formyltransferase
MTTETEPTGNKQIGMNTPRIIFMGTPDFSVPSLEILVNGGFDIAAVVTAPDKPAGRGLAIQESAVKKFALSKGLHLLQPEKLKDPVFIATLQKLRAQLQIVVAFRMLPEIVWNMPPLGTINVHGSLLPQYRGAAPVNWAIINGEKETGVTTFRLQHEIDTGNILLQQRMTIGDTETAGELYDRMKIAGAGLLLQTLQQLNDGILKETPQAFTDSSGQPQQLHHAPKISTDTGEIHWNRPVADIYNLVRGLSPYPAAFTFLNGKKLKIFTSEKDASPVMESPGEIVTDNRSFLKFTCNDGYLSVKEIQLEGKKKMQVGDFLRGWRVN